MSRPQRDRPLFDRKAHAILNTGGSEPGVGRKALKSGAGCGTWGEMPHGGCSKKRNGAEISPRPVSGSVEENYFFFSSFMGTAQPPLALQLFLPAQPASPLLQPPWPLQAFLALHSCLADVAQPPLPLQLFLPAQPPSPVLQPPWLLQAFWPLQTCLSSALNTDADALPMRAA